MGKSTRAIPAKPNGGIPTLFVVWLICSAAAVACMAFLPKPEGPNPGPTEGVYRAITILGLVAFAIIDSIIAAIKTFKRRRALGAAVKSMGYSPFFFTTGSIGTYLQRLFAE